VERPATYVPLAEVVDQVSGLLRADDRLDDELRELDVEARDPFA
jgi:hypothetical protein